MSDNSNGRKPIDLNNFDPHEFMRQIEEEPLHVIDLTGDEKVEYTIPPKAERKVHGLTYEQWMQQVNQHVIALSGVSQDDIGDWNSWDAWNSGTSPATGAHEALAESDFPFDDED